MTDWQNPDTGEEFSRSENEDGTHDLSYGNGGLAQFDNSGNPTIEPISPMGEGFE